MNCPICREPAKVANTRVRCYDGNQVPERLRTCPTCGHQWKTVELSVDGLTHRKREIAVGFINPIIEQVRHLP